MTLLWVTQHIVMGRLIETMKKKMFLCGNFALKALQIGDIMLSNEMMQFSFFYWKSNEKKADEKTTLFHDGICHDCDIA